MKPWLAPAGVRCANIRRERFALKIKVNSNNNSPSFGGKNNSNSHGLSFVSFGTTAEQQNGPSFGGLLFGLSFVSFGTRQTEEQSFNALEQLATSLPSTAFVPHSVYGKS